MPFADLHCHNHSRSYLWLKPQEDRYRRRDEFNPWTVVSSNLRAERNAKGSAAAYGQCDLVKLWNGGVRLTFNSLYSMEKGFFQTASKVSSGRNRFLRELVRNLTSHRMPLRDALQMFYMRIPDGMVDALQSPGYDYWGWLKDEYKFAISKSGERTTNAIVTPGLVRKIFESRNRRRSRHRSSLDARGIYQVPRSRQEAVQLMNDDIITMVLTMEGAHCFGSDQVSYPQLRQRLLQVKHDRQQFPFPFFFLTFAHHFNNFLCGHAKSLPDLGKWFLNQDDGMNGPFTMEGRKFLRLALSLRETNAALDQPNTPDPTAGYRMLIDVKHMSARSRQEYYQLVNERWNAGDPVPVIASHCGYSGIPTLQQHINNEQLERDNYTDITGHFNAWNINVCDEDIRMIFRTHGLFGLSFDQRILGVPKGQKSDGGQNSIQALWSNLKAVLNVIYSSADIAAADKHRIWNCITIGTDNEGFIDPINRYNTVLDFDLFRADLIHAIEIERQRADASPCIRHFASRAQVEVAVDCFCFTNAQRFVAHHYPTL